LGDRNGIWPVKNGGVLRVIIYLKRDVDLHMVQLMPLPFTVSCFSKIQIGFIFLVLAHPGSLGQKAVKRVCVCVCVCVLCVQLTYCVDFSVASVNCVMVHNRCSIGVTMLSLQFNPQLFPPESRLITHTHASVHQHKLVSANDHKAQKLRR